DATIVLAAPQGAAATAKINGNVKNLSVTTADPAKPIENETVAIDLVANSAADLSTVTANGTIKSSFTNTTLKDVKYAMNAVGIWDQLQNAVVDVAAPDLPKLYNVMQAFSTTPANAQTAIAFAIDDPDRPASGGDIISGGGSGQIATTQP